MFRLQGSWGVGEQGWRHQKSVLGEEGHVTNLQQPWLSFRMGVVKASGNGGAPRAKCPGAIPAV